MTERNYPLFPAEGGGYGGLIDHVPRRDEPRDSALDDVRQAVRQASQEERREQLADKYGADGINRMLVLNDEVKALGPNAVPKYQALYATAPRLPVEDNEPERSEDDFTRSARLAFRQESKKQTAAERERARAGIDRLAAEHGGEEIIETMGNWHQDDPQPF
jgi:hypothetical protein